MRLRQPLGKQRSRFVALRALAVSHSLLWLPGSAGLLLAGHAPPSAAQCPLNWTGGYTEPGLGNFLYNAFGATAFDDGSGPALYLYGQIIMPRVSANNLVRWSTDGWSRPGPNPNGFAVYDGAVFHDGSGPSLYIVGPFTQIGGQDISGIARWDGSSWSDVSGGLNGNGGRSLAVFDDGSGPALFVTGNFTEAGGVPVEYVARWNGSEWAAAGSGLDIGAHLHAVDGELYGAGGFMFARWDGSTWQPIEGIGGQVSAVTKYDDGTGLSLYVGGFFEIAGGQVVNNVARWDGTNWAPLGEGCDSFVYDLTVIRDGGRELLCVAGWFAQAGGQPAGGIATWDGTAWGTLGSGVGMKREADPGIVYEVVSFDDGAGSSLYAIGLFTHADGVRSEGIARWADGKWSGLGHGILDVGFPVLQAFAVHDDGNGPALYAAGNAEVAGGLTINHVGRWDGRYWTVLDRGVGNISGTFGAALLSHDDGGGRALFVGGDFRRASGVLTPGIARWRDGQFEAVGGGMTGNPAAVSALAAWNDGRADALFAAGSFTEAGGVAAAKVARWDGAAWEPLGAGVNDRVNALCVYGGASEPALFVGGRFTQAGQQAAAGIARWDGAWTPVGSGITGGGRSVSALCVYDSGGGPQLIAGGSFTMAGGVPASNIAAWNGVSWQPLDTGLNGECRALAVFDRGDGPVLYVGGFFTQAGSTDAQHIARWDGDSWQRARQGVDGQGVFALQVFDDGTGSALYVGGQFFNSGAFPADHFARWGCPPESCDPCDTNCDGAVDAFDIEPFIELLVDPNAPRCASCSGDANSDGFVDAFDIEPFINCLTP